MKKTLYILITILLLILLLPIIGNRIVVDILKDRIELVTSYGVEVVSATSSSNYFTTTKHYEFLLKDADKIVEYLQQFSDNQLPPYTSTLIDGIIIGADLKYSNFPLSDDISSDLYLLDIPTFMKNNLKKSDKNFLKYLKKLTESKSILLHMDYNLVDSSFDGYIKNIDEEYLSSDEKLFFNISDAMFNGTGPIVSPESFNSAVGTVSFSVIYPEDEFRIDLNKLYTSTQIESKTTYASTLKVGRLEYFLNTQYTQNNFIDLVGLYMNISSNTQNPKAQLYSKSSINELRVETGTWVSFINNFNLDIAIDDIDKDSYEEFSKVVSKSRVEDSEELTRSLLKLLSNGVDIKIADFSISSIEIVDVESFGGFKINSDTVLKGQHSLNSSDNSFSSILKNLNSYTNINISKNMFNVLNREYPITVLAMPYAKEDGDNLVFDIYYKDNNILVNGKELK